MRVWGRGGCYASLGVKLGEATEMIEKLLLRLMGHNLINVHAFFLICACIKKQKSEMHKKTKENIFVKKKK